MQEVDVNDWEDFERHVSELRRRHDAASLLFRGLGDSRWPLTTTLERNGYVGMLFADYYRIVAASKPQIETFTNASWDIPEYPEIERLGHEYDEFSLHLAFGKFQGYGYMAYLRHHGFPSPLLDWTQSPYIAAFFAFRSPIRPTADKVSIFAYCESPERMKSRSSNEPQIFRLGPNVRAHRRHFLQQGEYTVCLHFDSEWRFSAHETVFGRGTFSPGCLVEVQPSMERTAESAETAR